MVFKFICIHLLSIRCNNDGMKPTYASVAFAYCRFFYVNITDFCLQCFDAVGWVAGRASGL